jgi:hypothetical protein
MTSCPYDFQESGAMCYAKCPNAFKYMEEQGAAKCVYKTNNSLFVTLTPVPKFPIGQPEPSTFAYARKQLAVDLSDVYESVSADVESQKRLASESQTALAHNAMRTGIGGRYAAFREGQDDIKKMREVIDSLKPMRPPTAPKSDIEMERKAIVDIVTQNILILQIALFAVFLCLLSYVILPAAYAHGISFLVLCVAVAVGFFLIE